MIYGKRTIDRWGCVAGAAVLCAAMVARASATDRHSVIRHVQQRVVKIFGAGGLGSLAPYASGFLVSPEGHVVTVWSHVLDAETVTVVLDNGRRFSASVLGAEPPLDLAVLKLDLGDYPPDLSHFDLESEAGTASVGTRIFAFSNMFQVATGDEPVSVQRGVVAAFARFPFRRGAYVTTYDGPVYVVDAVTNNSGAEGGVITTLDGRLIGMIGKQRRHADTSAWVNYALPISTLKQPIREIITGTFRPSTPQERAERTPKNYRPRDFGLVLVPDVVFRTPAFIDAVIPGSPAQKAGLRADDPTVFDNDQLTQSIRDVEESIGRLQPGERLRIVVRRGDELIAVEMTAPAKPAAP
ncbi:MAG: serine protease [Planctomycetota bacterium]|nr:MAG: serine protease [Planctomycetota bacterium]